MSLKLERTGCVFTNYILKMRERNLIREKGRDGGATEVVCNNWILKRTDKGQSRRGILNLL